MKRNRFNFPTGVRPPGSPPGAESTSPLVSAAEIECHPHRLSEPLHSKTRLDCWTGVGVRYRSTGRSNGSPGPDSRHFEREGNQTCGKTFGEKEFSLTSVWRRSSYWAWPSAS